MSVVLQCNGLFIGKIFPTVKLVNCREDIDINCIFSGNDQADGVIRVLRSKEEYAREVLLKIDYDSIPSKYQNIITHAYKELCRIKVLQDSTKPLRCGCCSVTIPVAKYIFIETYSGTLHVSICPFCAAKLGEIGNEAIKDIPESIQNEYYTHLVERGLAWLSEPANNNSKDLSDLPF